MDSGWHEEIARVCAVGVVVVKLASQVEKGLSFSFHQAIKPRALVAFYLCCDLITL